MKNILAIFILALSFASCSKDEGNIPLSEQLLLRFELSDSTGNARRQFAYGDNLFFRYREINSSTKSVTYIPQNCPMLGIKIVEAEGTQSWNLFSNLNCTLELRHYTLKGGEATIYEANWFHDSSNVALEPGTYLVKFENTVSNDANEEVKISEEIRFTVE